jgi:LAGLIDADG-like domain
MIIDLSAKILARTRLTRWWNSPVAWGQDVLRVSPADYQAEVLDALPRERRVAVKGPHGLGKAQDTQTTIPTPCGWTTIADILPGDEVFDENGKACRVTGKSPVYLGPTYEVEFANGGIQTVHGEHEWNVVDVYDQPKGVTDWRDHWAHTRTRTTAYMAERLRSPGGQFRWSVPTVRPLELPAASLPVDPYTLGMWLGDGTSATGQICLKLGGSEFLASRLPSGHFIPSGDVKTRMYRVDGLSAQLRGLGLLRNKHIPMAYLRASIEQRRELVRGLWDSDGYQQAGGSDEITLTNERLARSVEELLTTLGLVVRFRTGRATIAGKDYGPRYCIAARFDFNPYHLPWYDWTPRGAQASRHTQHKIVDIRRVEDRPTQCIEVDSPSHLYLTGPSMIPTHNSFMGAYLVNWFATTREMAGKDWKIITTASAWRHLEVYLWPEIHKWAGRIDFETLGRPPFNPRTELLDLRLKLPNGAATAVASNQPERIEGAHAEELLYLLDEAKIIPPATWDSIEGAFSNAGPDTADNAYAFAMSTPGPPSGRFYEIHQRAPGYEDWWTRSIKLEEAIEAGRISRLWADQRRLQWGEDSAVYQNRVLGNFHASDEDSVIPLAWLEDAIERWHEWDRAGRPPQGGPIWTGVDVGRGGDESILAARDSHVIVLTGNRRRDTMSQVAELQQREGRAIIDVIGLGAGVYDRMKELNLRPMAYTGSGKSHNRDRSGKLGFANTRSAAYWHLRELLDPAFQPVLALPPDDLMISDLTTPTWQVTTGVPPKIQVEVKDKVVERLGRSPDRGDAVAMAMWADQFKGSGGRVAEPQGTMPTTGMSLPSR